MKGGRRKRFDMKFLITCKAGGLRNTVEWGRIYGIVHGSLWGQHPHDHRLRHPAKSTGQGPEQMPDLRGRSQAGKPSCDLQGTRGIRPYRQSDHALPQMSQEDPRRTAFQSWEALSGGMGILTQTPTEIYQAVHGIDSLCEPRTKPSRLYLLKYFIVFLIGVVLGYLMHLSLIWSTLWKNLFVFVLSACFYVGTVWQSQIL